MVAPCDRLRARCAYRRGGGGLRALFMLSECAQLGHLEPIAAAHGQGHGYDVQLFRVLQDVSRLRAIAKRDAVAVSDGRTVPAGAPMTVK
jgi:type IV secretory pathway TraG/TraD family ATPase VirD4